MRVWMVGLGLALVPMAALADDSPAEVKKQIEANFAKMIEAFKKHDIKGVMAVAADDYQGEAMGQKVNKAQMEGMMKQYMAETKKVNSAKYTVTGLKVKGNSATGKT